MIDPRVKHINLMALDHPRVGRRQDGGAVVDGQVVDKTRVVVPAARVDPSLIDAPAAEGGAAEENSSLRLAPDTEVPNVSHDTDRPRGAVNTAGGNGTPRGPIEEEASCTGAGGTAKLDRYGSPGAKHPAGKLVKMPAPCVSIRKTLVADMARRMASHTAVSSGMVASSKAAITGHAAHSASAVPTSGSGGVAEPDVGEHADAARMEMPEG